MPLTPRRKNSKSKQKQPQTSQSNTTNTVNQDANEQDIEVGERISQTLRKVDSILINTRTSGNSNTLLDKQDNDTPNDIYNHVPTNTHLQSPIDPYFITSSYLRPLSRSFSSINGLQTNETNQNTNDSKQTQATTSQQPNQSLKKQTSILNIKRSTNKQKNKTSTTTSSPNQANSPHLTRKHTLIGKFGELFKQKRSASKSNPAHLEQNKIKDNTSHNNELAPSKLNRTDKAKHNPTNNWTRYAQISGPKHQDEPYVEEVHDPQQLFNNK